MTRIKPMLATLVAEPFDDPNWIFEIKWDGFRALADISGKKVDLYSRNLLPFNDRFPLIVKSLQDHKLKALLDGEIVALDAKGKSHFQLLQTFQETGKGQLVYYVFDILFLNGKDLRSLPLLRRKELLKKILGKTNRIKYSEHIVGEGKKFFRVAQKQILEGIIAKEAGSIYHSGKRSPDWQKIKIRQEQEAVICGFTRPLGSRKYFGSLVLAAYHRGKLRYIGHSGGGFTQETLRQLHAKLNKIKIKAPPITEGPIRDQTITWVKPQYVCEVAFTEWTKDLTMRHPIFLGLRPDKDAKEVRREIV